MQQTRLVVAEDGSVRAEGLLRFTSPVLGHLDRAGNVTRGAGGSTTLPEMMGLLQSGSALSQPGLFRPYDIPTSYSYSRVGDGQGGAVGGEIPYVLAPRSLALNQAGRCELFGDEFLMGSSCEIPSPAAPRQLDMGELREVSGDGTPLSPRAL